MHDTLGKLIRAATVRMEHWEPILDWHTHGLAHWLTIKYTSQLYCVVFLDGEITRCAISPAWIWIEMGWEVQKHGRMARNEGMIMNSV